MRKGGRTFRVGLWLGILAATGFAVARILRSRRDHDAADSESWRVVEPPSPVVPSTPRVVPIVEPEVVEVSEEPWPAVAGDEPEWAEATPTPLPAEPLPPPKPVTPAWPSSITTTSTPVPSATPPPTPPPAPVPPRPAAPVAKKAAPVRKKAAAAKKAAPVKKAAAVKRAAPTWVDPDGRICPQSHPVKAKLASRLFHLPGMFAYERTNPDRCYRSAAAAEADGLRQSKR